MVVVSAALLVRQARGMSGLSQRALAERTGDYQPNVAAIESGARDAYVSTVSRLVEAAGGRLSVLPTRTATAAEVAVEVAHLIASRRERVAYRTVLGLHDDLVRADAALRVALCVMPPPLTGDRRFDALLAALVEHDLERDRLPVPVWARDPGRDAGGWWVEDLPELRAAVRKATPAAFARHGVWLDAGELESV
jgi:transcriptional regulator with XRE-family HTH domain